VPHLTDATLIRAILETDRNWAAYALGDLAPGFVEHAEWYRGGDTTHPALLLLYRLFTEPVLFSLGEAADVAQLLTEIKTEPALYLSIRPEILPLIKARYTVQHEAAMWRMILNPARFQVPPNTECTRLDLSHLPALRALYTDGQATGEVPDFFDELMLENGVFYGAYDEHGILLASAGTHLVAPHESVAAVGNVYTRRDQRGRGLARRVTGAVVADLLRGTPTLRTVALNVNQQNLAALTVYEHLGFERYCQFYEGLATSPS